MYLEQSNYFSYGFGCDMSAANYFDSLPEDVKRAINKRPEEFHSVAELRRYAEAIKKKKICKIRKNIRCHVR